MTDENIQETLNRILEGLKSNDAASQLAAINDLERVNFSSEAILRQLERLALHAQGAVQKFAMDALLLKTSQFVASKRSPAPRPERQKILAEIEKWEKDRLIEPYHAEILRRRYDFDLQPGRPVRTAAAPIPEEKPAHPAEAVPAVQPAAPAPIQPEPAPLPPPKPTGPRPGLTQVLLSETSIRIYLYLGAFFVIAAAAILAALVEAARLPILLIATLAFAAGAVGFKKRLPQPSFAFAIVFSFLLPIDATVIADTFRLNVQAHEEYWAVVCFVMTILWLFSTWFYESRLFSLTSYLALTLCLLYASEIFQASANWNLFAVALSNLAALFGVNLLKQWKDAKFSGPLHLSIQALQLVTLLVLVVNLFINLFESDFTSGDWLAAALVWLLAAAFYAASQFVFPFVLFPWMSAASLFLFPWLFLSAFNASAPTQIFGFGVWAALAALTSEFLLLSKKDLLRSFHYPFLALSLPLFMVATLWGAVEGLVYAFAALLGTAIVYTLIHLLRPRWYVWSSALLAGLGAFLTFFGLSFMESRDVYLGYQLLIASALLLIPELFFKGPFTLENAWHWPPIALGVMVTVLNVFLAIAAPLDDARLQINTAIMLGGYALLFAAQALRFRQPLIGYLATTSTAFTGVYALSHFRLDLWLPVLTILAALYYGAGFWLARRDQTKPWAWMLIISGLSLGAIIASIAVLTLKPFGGWYALGVAGLFLLEMFTRRKAYLEWFVAALLSMALVIILNDFKVHELAYYFFGLSLIWLVCDAGFKLSFAGRKLSFVTQGIAALTVAATVVEISINHGLASGHAAICFGVYTACFAAYALIHNLPALGYLSTAGAAAGMFYALDAFQIKWWLPVFTALAAGYYLTGFLLRRRGAGWSEMFRHSGLALGGLVALVALLNLEPTGGWYAVVIGGLFAVETGSSRNGWFEAGVHLLVSIAVFIILLDLHINEYSYILLGLSLVWLGGDLTFEKTFDTRKVRLPVQLVGTAVTALNAFSLFFSPYPEAALCFGVYALFFAGYAGFQQRPVVGFASTAALPLAVFSVFLQLGMNRWLFALIAIAVLYYLAGYFMRRGQAAKGWDFLLLASGLGLGTLVALSAPLQNGGAEKAIPIAVAATLFAVEAHARRNIWLAFPANGLYLIAYFTLLVELNADEPQYFSIGAAFLGMLMNYLLVRAGSKTGAFIMGMLSQLALLGTTYIQMIALLKLSFFFVLFIQSLAILAYGILMRSRSLVIAPIGFAVLGVVTVMYYALRDLSVVVIIGIAGLILLTSGILAVLMRERITTLAERFSDWNA